MGLLEMGFIFIMQFYMHFFMHQNNQPRILYQKHNTIRSYTAPSIQVNSIQAKVRFEEGSDPIGGVGS